MTPEYLAEVDSDDKVLAVHPKEKLKEIKFRHRISLVLPKAPGNKFYFARRAKNKFPFPDVWTCAVGGKVRADESYEQACLREMQEEVGFETKIDYVATSKLDLPDEKAIAKIYTTAQEIPLVWFKLDPAEIQFLTALSIEEMARIITKNPQACAPTFRKHFQVFQENYCQFKGKE